jgi:hypothetical protein
MAGPAPERSVSISAKSEGVTVAAAGGQVRRGMLAHVERDGASLSGLRLAIVIDDAASAKVTASALSDPYCVKILRIRVRPPTTSVGTRGSARR